MSANNNGNDNNEGVSKQDVLNMIDKVSTLSAWLITDYMRSGYTQEQMDAQIGGIQGFQNVFAVHNVPFFGQTFTVTFGTTWDFAPHKGKAYYDPVVIVGKESIRKYHEQLAYLEKVLAIVIERRKALPEPQEA